MMSSSYEERYVIKLTSVSSFDTSHEEAIQELAERIETEDSSPPPFTIRRDGLAVTSLTAVDRIVNNPRINREGGNEIHIDVSPSLANIPSEGCFDEVLKTQTSSEEAPESA